MERLGLEGVYPAADQVLYELHIGTFTPEGTWNAAAEKLGHLADTGITCLEVMPVAEFPGRFGWGYDGVDLFVPTRLYGKPDEFRAFVDRGAWDWGSADRSGCGVQPHRAGRELPQSVFAGLFQHAAQDGLGRGDQLRREGERAGAGSFSFPTPASGSR